MKTKQKKRKNGLTPTARNPRAAGRPKEVLSPAVLERRRKMQAERQKRFAKSHARLNIYVSSETSEAISDEALKKGVSRSSIAQKIIENHFETKKNKASKCVNHGSSETSCKKNRKKIEK